MNMRYKLILYTLLVLNFVTLSIIQTTNASSIGSIFTNRHVVMNPGEVRVFKASMFNLDSNNPVDITFSLLTPIYTSSYGKDLEVYVIDKNYNTINHITMQANEKTKTPSSEYEWFLNPDGTTYTRTYPFYIYVKVPNKPTFAKNKYKLVISAKTKPEQISSSIAQSVSQERQFVIDIDIHGLLESNNINTYNYNQNQYNTNLQNQENNQNQNTQTPGVIIKDNLVYDTGEGKNQEELQKDNYIYTDYGKDKEQKENNDNINNNELNTNNRTSTENILTGHSIQAIKEHPYSWSTIIILIGGTLILTYLWFK